MQESDLIESSQSEKILKWASRLSVVISILVLTLKTIAYFKTHSQAVLSDAVESIVNVIASLVALWIIHASSEPADDQHPYGHGKLEYFSATFEGGLVCFAAVMISVEATRALVMGHTIANFELGFAYSILASFLNLGLGLFLKSVGRKHHSIALSSSGSHVLSDLWTTAGSLVGLGLVWISGVVWIDALVALLMAGYLLIHGYRIVRTALGGLLDEQDEESLTKLASVFEKNRFPGIIDIHQARIIRAGRFHHVDAHVVVPEFWDVSEAHNQTNLFESKVVRDYYLTGEIAFHVDPCQRSYCAQCEMADCPVRLLQFESRPFLNWRSLTQKPPTDAPLTAASEGTQTPSPSPSKRSSYS